MNSFANSAVAGDGQVTITPVPLSATVAVGTNLNPAMKGASVTVTSTVSGVAGDPAPTGTVSFYDAGTLFGVGTLTAGKASVTTGALAAGSHPLTAVYSGDANYTTTYSAPLTEQITAPVAKPSATAVSFGDQIVHTTSAGKALTVTNAGTAPLHVSSVSLTGTSFAVTGKTCTGAAITPGHSCAVTVAFTPSAVAVLHATLQVASDGGKVVVDLSGSGVAAVSPTVTGVSPNSGYTYGGIQVNITGTNLANATAVSFGATPATIVGCSATSCVVVSPPSNTYGAVDVRATNAVGTSAITSADQFRYTAHF